MPRPRYVVATLIAPLSCPILFWTLHSILSLFYRRFSIVPVNLAGTLLLTFLGYAGLFIFGFPWIYVLRRLRRLNLFFLILGGMIGGAVFSFLYGTVFSLYDLREHSLAFLSTGIGMGGSVALLFGWIAGVPME